MEINQCEGDEARNITAAAVALYTILKDQWMPTTARTPPKVRSIRQKQCYHL
jgi:hypothetical protein